MTIYSLSVPEGSPRWVELLVASAAVRLDDLFAYPDTAELRWTDNELLWLSWCDGPLPRTVAKRLQMTRTTRHDYLWPVDGREIRVNANRGLSMGLIFAAIDGLTQGREPVPWSYLTDEVLPDDYPEQVRTTWAQLHKEVSPETFQGIRSTVMEDVHGAYVRAHRDEVRRRLTSA